MSAIGFVYNLFKAQWLTTVPPQNSTFEGQTVIITGGNTGLGLAAAKYMVTHQAARVVIACRNVNKGEIAKKQLEDLAGGTSVVELWPLDLSSYPSIKGFVAQANNELDRLDVVVCNAGVQYPSFELVNDIEGNVAINVVSTFLLALLILPKLKQTASKHTSATPHLAIVSSDTHYLVSLDKQHKNQDERIFDQLNDKKHARMYARYPLSKLLDILLTQQLVQHLPNDYPVIINTVNPGLCYSELSRDSPPLARKILNTAFHARTADVGIRNYICAVSSGREMHGKYISECAEGLLGPSATGEHADVEGARVWEELKNLLEGISPGIIGEL